MPSTIQTSTNQQFWSSPAADPPTVTPSGTAWAASAWTELIAAASLASCLTAIHLATMGTASTDFRWEIEVGVGAAGSEVVIASIPMSSAVANIAENDSSRWTIPVDLIPAGSRVAVRMRKSGTNTTTWSFSIGYIEKPIVGGAIPMTVSANAPYSFPAAAEPTSLPGAGGASAAWANGAWTTIMTSPISDAVLLGYNVLWASNGAVREIDLAVGPSGSEAIIHTTKLANMSIPAGPSFQELVNPLDAIRVGVRVSGRQRFSVINNTTAQGVKLLLMNKPL